MNSKQTTAAEAILSKTLEQIAQQEIGIETLEVRNSDDLDFHDISVATLERALRAAFQAGLLQGTAGLPHIPELIKQAKEQTATRRIDNEHRERKEAADAIRRQEVK